MNQMREEFETWAKPLGFDMDYIYADDEFKCYCFTATQNVFEVWRAGWEKSRALQCVKIPKRDEYSEIPYGTIEIFDVQQALDDAGVKYK